LHEILGRGCQNPLPVLILWRYASIATHYPLIFNLEIPIGIIGNPLSDRYNGLLWLFNVVGKWLKLVALRYTLGWPLKCPLYPQ
jgi:hypothetical protein